MTICQIQKTAALGILCVLAWAIPGALATAQQTPAPETGITADQIAHLLVEHNELRAKRLQHYNGVRHYHLEYHGLFGAREAAMDVEASYDAPATKNFHVVSETGSKIFISRVLKKLLDSEKEATDENNRRQTALTPDNYNFQLDSENATDDAYYVLKVEPRTDNKYLYRGKIWVDRHDFAVARIEAEPARNPSFWTKKTEIHQKYTRVGDFWLPEQNKTVTIVRMGGLATLQIDYTGYEVAAAQATASDVAAATTTTKRREGSIQRQSSRDAAVAAPVNLGDASAANSFATPAGHN